MVTVPTTNCYSSAPLHRYHGWLGGGVSCFSVFFVFDTVRQTQFFQKIPGDAKALANASRMRST